MRLFWSNDSLAGRRGRRTRAENDAKITWASPCALSARICASKFHAMAQGHCVPPTSFCSHLPLDFYPYVLSNFRHFYARKGGTLKWRHRVVAYGCGYSEITVSVYASRSPRLSSYLPITHFSCNPFVYLVYRTISFCIAHLPSSRMVLRFLMPWERDCSCPSFALFKDKCQWNCRPSIPSLDTSWRSVKRICFWTDGFNEMLEQRLIIYRILI